MRRMIALLAAGSLAAPSLAQVPPQPHAGEAHSPAGGHEGHAMPPDSHAGHAMPEAEVQSDPHAGHAMPEPEAESDPHAGHGMPEPEAQADPHAGHAMPDPEARSDPHAGHAMPDSEAQSDPHAGHAMPDPEAQADPHAGHAMPEGGAQSDTHAAHAATETLAPAAPPPAEALSGPAHAADLVFGEARMAAAREELRKTHGDILTWKLLVDRLEARIRDGDDGYAWDAQFWWGGDIDKLWLKTEGEGAFGGPVEAAEIQALWSRAIDPWFDLQLGLRHDFRPDPERTYLVAGVQGLAPYWFEVDGALFLSDEGDLSARFEGEYDLRLTQRIIVQPRAELELALQDVPELGIGSGLSAAELGVRLRYEIEPEFAPYVGVEYERTFGDTADFRRTAGEEAGGWSLLLGVRAWF